MSNPPAQCLLKKHLNPLQEDPNIRVLGQQRISCLTQTKGGETVSTGIVGVAAAYRGPTLLVKQVETT